MSHGEMLACFGDT